MNSSSVNNFAGAVNLTCSTPLASVSCQVNGPPLYIPGQPTVTVQTQNAPLGAYAITVTGAIGSVSHTVTEQLAVGNVTASVTPTSATIAVGAQGTFAVAVSSQGGFTGTLAYYCTNDVGAVVCQFDPASATLPANGSTSTTLTLRVQSKPASAIRASPTANPRASVEWLCVSMTLLAGMLLGWKITDKNRGKGVDHTLR